jgi:BTB/POZ domain
VLFQSQIQSQIERNPPNSDPPAIHPVTVMDATTLSTTTTETNEKTTVGPEQCADLWYEDGTVVLQAGAKQFRVYRGILCSHSPVFHDMLSFPQPPSEETFEGQPLVHMPDSPSDLYYFLKTLHDAG